MIEDFFSSTNRLSGRRALFLSSTRLLGLLCSAVVCNQLVPVDGAVVVGEFFQKLEHETVLRFIKCLLKFWAVLDGCIKHATGNLDVVKIVTGEHFPELLARHFSEGGLTAIGLFFAPVAIAHYRVKPQGKFGQAFVQAGKVFALLFLAGGVKYVNA